MGIIRKVHPTDINLINHIYGIITSLERTEYKDLTLDILMECRDSIYIYIDDCYNFGEYPSIDGIIACRRTDMDTINIDKLLYHCQPNKIMYAIEALYVFQCEDVEKYKNILRQLLEVCFVDKNDAFISTKLFYYSEKIVDKNFIDILLNHDFYLNSYEKGIYTYTKIPTTVLNRSN